MKVRMGILGLVLSLFAAGSAFAGSVTFNFGGPDRALGTSQSYMSGNATITVSGYECTASDSTSMATLSACSARALYQKDDGGAEVGLGLAGETDHEIGFDGNNADFVLGLDLSDLVNLGANSITLTFGSVQPGEAFAALGYGANPFGSTFTLTNTKAWCGFETPGCVYNGDVVSATFDLNAQDQFLVLMSPCGASLTNQTGDCGSNVTLDSAVAATPEPGTLTLFATALLALGFGVRRRFAFQRQ